MRRYSLFLIVVLACAKPTLPNAPLSFAECISEPDVVDYLHSVRDTTLHNWTAPAGGANYSVKFRFELGAAGEVIRATAIEGGPQEVLDSAVLAMRRSSPFGDLPPCLAGVELVGIFEVTPE